MANLVDKLALLERLERIQPEEKAGGEEEYLRKISLASALLALAEIDHEREYALCRSVAKHLLGEVPEVEEIEIEEE